MTVDSKEIATQEWFRAFPCGLLALDGEGRIAGINPALESVIGLPAGQLLGHTRESLPSPAHRCLFDAGEPCCFQTPGRENWLQCQVWKLRAAGEGVTLHLYQDITETRRLQRENECLRRQVEELAITDDLTGLANRRALNQMLEAQVSRSRRYQNPLSIALVEVVPAGGRIHTLTGFPDELIIGVSSYLRDRLRWADVLGRWDEERFMLVLPETPGDAARSLVENIGGGLPAAGTAVDNGGMAFRLRLGLAEWRKGLDVRRLIEQAEQALAAPEATTGSSSR